MTPETLTDAAQEALYRRRLVEAQVPEHLHGGIVRYLVDHIRPGSFLLAVLTGDARLAEGRADPESRQGLADVYTFLHLSAPSSAWGSDAKVTQWLRESQ